MASRWTGKRVPHARPGRVICDRCGDAVAAPMLATHQRGQRCQRGATLRKIGIRLREAALGGEIALARLLPEGGSR
jgi:hypothetical protein